LYSKQIYAQLIDKESLMLYLFFFNTLINVSFVVIWLFIMSYIKRKES